MRRSKLRAPSHWFVLAVAFPAGLFGPSSTRAQGLPPIATLLVYGEVIVNGRPATDRMALSSGDTVTTGPTGHAEVRLNRGGSVESDTGTTVQVADRSDPGFWRGLVVSGNEYLSCLSRVVFTSGQIYWTGTGQATCFDPSGLGNIVAHSQFNLQLAPGRGVLTVAEGQVTVSALQQLTVPANMQILIANGRVIDQRQVSREELDRITAWRRWRDFWRPYVPRPIPPVIPRVAPPTIGPR